LIQKTYQIQVNGLIQGVGFRPFVYRLATRLNITGWIKNTNEGVFIMITCLPCLLDEFIHALFQELPAIASLEKVVYKESETTIFDDFQILKSDDISDQVTEISPDIAVCQECIDDMKCEGPRHNYVFVNCTNCGPRFTIIRDLPYDRNSTTMDFFPMCEQCKKEYETITDRRFHAQPVACMHCGPHYEHYSHGILKSDNIEQIIADTSRLIDQGSVILIKGLGGMHLACDAFNEEAVNRLRTIKQRDGKPFAVMFSDLASASLFAQISDEEAKVMTSWKRPIVLVEPGKPGGDTVLAPGISNNLQLLGIMLPYMPLHHLLFNTLKTRAIVLTSGNFSNEPILIENDAALKQFSQLTDGIILNNRDIHNRTDDSVVRMMAGQEQVFRRSRGYVPSPVRTQHNLDGILAFGAELANCFCIGKSANAIFSQHIGDLKSFENNLFYEQTIERFLRIFRVKPRLLAIDLHPDYYSTKAAARFKDVPVETVQHHHAHIASCMAENQLDEKVIGVALDGTGLGDDGNIWGGEFLICDMSDYERIAHFEYVPLPGGDRAAEEPWRMAVAYLYKVFGFDIRSLKLPVNEEVESEKISLLINMMDKGINCPLTSSAGRLFDAVASICGLTQVSTFHAEAPLRLESALKFGITDRYHADIHESISFHRTIEQIVEDVIQRVPVSVISSKFHNTLIWVIFEVVKRISLQTGTRKVVLSGGVFQNKYLVEGVVKILKMSNLTVFTHASVPPNDGGIALGQMVVAAKRREKRCV